MGNKLKNVGTVLISNLKSQISNPRCRISALRLNNLALLFPPKVYKMRLVAFDDLSRRDSLRNFPNEIHLRMDSAERQPRLKNQEHAAIKKKERADQAKDYRQQRITKRTDNGDYANSHTGGHKRAQR